MCGSIASRLTPGIADDRHVHVDVLADRAGVDVDVDDLGVRGEGGEVAGHAVVKPSADGDQAVAFLHGVVGERAAVHAEHVQGLRVVLVERAQAQQRGGAGDVALVRRPCGPPRQASADDRAAADVQHRLFAVD